MPSNKVVTFKYPDGNVGVMVIGKAVLDRNGGDEDAAYAEELARPGKLPGDATLVDVVTRASLPDGRYRAAWRKAGAVTSVDMPAARVLHMNDVRVYRDKKLAEEDINYQRADENNDGAEKAAVAARKNALRSIPNAGPFLDTVNAAADPDTLYALWPTELDPRT